MSSAYTPPVESSPEAELKGCPCCGLVQRVPAPAGDLRYRCARCRSLVWKPGLNRAGNRMAAGAAMAALILYPLAVSLPIMHVSRFGRITEASIWSGTWSLLEDGQPLVGLVVLMCSIVLPLFKLVGLLVITLGGRALRRRHRVLTYRWIEWTGRYGMLDVLLIAILVAWIKVGGLMEVHAGDAALAFTGVVALSLLASACFDPHALWESEGAPDPAES